MRLFGYTLIAAGALAASYLALVLSVGDPITGLYAGQEQRQLKTELLRSELGARQPVATPQPAATAGRYASVSRVAASKRPSAGSALGTIVIPRIGLNAVFVEGTATADLDKAPGHYPGTALPGSRGLVAIAAHRTTYGAWFRHIDSLQPGDPIFLDFEGRRSTYTVSSHRIVLPTDWSIVRYRGFPELVLTSCHPVYSASHRYVVFARLAGSKPSSGSAGSR